MAAFISFSDCNYFDLFINLKECFNGEIVKVNWDFLMVIVIIKTYGL